uniref:Uncharacterized protein n=1 Tax=Anguilla anguilla TaxID=7936 RepID=A0A0E9VT63_ANGAN
MRKQQRRRLSTVRFARLNNNVPCPQKLSFILRLLAY